MSDTMVTTGYTELPVFFETTDARLFGVVTLPQSGSVRTGIVILPGAGTPFTVNRNRLSVRMARQLVRLGYAVLRCDYHGTGDSTGFVEGFRLDRPFDADVRAAVARFHELGVERVILVGSCFGGRSALAAAAEISDVDAVVLLATSLRDHERGGRKAANAAATWNLGRYAVEALRLRRLKGLLDRRSRERYARYARAKLRRSEDRSSGSALVGPSYERPMRALLERGVPIVQIFGTDDSSLQEYREATAGPLADALRAAPDGVEVRTIPGRIHGFLSPPIQDAVVEAVVAWAAERGAGDPAPAPASSETA